MRKYYFHLKILSDVEREIFVDEKNFLYYEKTNPDFIAFQSKISLSIFFVFNVSYRKAPIKFFELYFPKMILD